MNPVIGPSTAASVATKPQKTDGASSVLSSDFETFLQMLTAQAKYQDPLEPIDSSQYAAQLAQFSMVEQQVMSNDLLTALSNQFGAGNMAQLAGWIGMDARSDAPVQFDGTPITVIPGKMQPADDYTLVVYDANNTEVQRVKMPNGKDPVDWAGVQNNGTPFADGAFRFSVESRTNGQLVATTRAEAYGRVTEARNENGQTMLILEGGSSISAGQVSALRQPA